MKRVLASVEFRDGRKLVLSRNTKEIPQSVAQELLNAMARIHKNRAVAFAVYEFLSDEAKLYIQQYTETNL